MKKVLLILDGMLSKHLIQRVSSIVTNNNHYHVIYYNDDILPQNRPENIRFYKFDTTSLSKLSQVASNEYIQIMVLASTKSDTEAILKNLQNLNISTNITVLDKWDLDFSTYGNPNLSIINSNNFLSNVMTLQLPNIPTTAQSIGQGRGEIMEVKIPFGSSYVYRHLSSIKQNNFKIVSIYRESSMLIASPHHVIQPNDTLLLIGEPEVLLNIYKAIKNETGQFPAPFGNNIYLVLDLLKKSLQDVISLIAEALYLHQNLNNIMLHIKVINASTIDKINVIKDIQSDRCIVKFEYDNINTQKMIKDDIKDNNIGLVIVDTDTLFSANQMEFYYSLQIPIYKSGSLNIEFNKDLVLFLNENIKLEKISPIVFDISNQLSFNIVLLDYDPEGNYKSELIEHFDNLSRIYSREIHLIQDNKNPIREAKKRQNFLHILPFTENMLKSSSYRKYISVEDDMMIYELRDYPLVLIP